jgi:hypothetical protein
LGGKGQIKAQIQPAQIKGAIRRFWVRKLVPGRSLYLTKRKQNENKQGTEIETFIPAKARCAASMGVK